MGLKKPGAEGDGAVCTDCKGAAWATALQWTAALRQYGIYYHFYSY